VVALSEACDTSVTDPVARSKRKTPPPPLALCPATRFFALDVKATNAPSALETSDELPVVAAVVVDDGV
jgi:hypothetical protein